MVLLVLIVEVWYLLVDGFSLLCACWLVVVVVVEDCEEEEEEEEVLLLSELEVLVDEVILCGEREDLVLLS